MKHHTEDIAFATTEPVQFIDLTDRVRVAFEASGIREGLLAVFTRHTTTAVVINERCERLQQDMLAFLERAVPSVDYRHDESTVDGRANARGHLMSLLLGASETIPVSAGKLLLGEWQTVFFVELDGPRRERTVTVKIIGG